MKAASVVDNSIEGRRQRISAAEPIFRECRMEMREIKQIVDTVRETAWDRLSDREREGMIEVQQRLAGFIQALS